MQEQSWPNALYARIVAWLRAVGWQLSVEVFMLYLKTEGEAELWEQVTPGIGRIPAAKLMV